MPVADLLTAQLTDILRIGLIVGLLTTTLRTQAVSGRVLPLILGVVFVAVILPITRQVAVGALFWWSVGLGILANLIILAVVFGTWKAVSRWRS